MTTLICLSLISNRVMLHLGSELFQEIIVFALYYLLIYFLVIKSNKDLLILPIIAAAMLTRELFWAYYLVWGLIFLPKIKSYSIIKILYFLLISLIPITFLFLTKQPIIIGTDFGTDNFQIDFIVNGIINLLKLVMQYKLTILLFNLFLINLLVLAFKKVGKYL